MASERPLTAHVTPQVERPKVFRANTNPHVQSQVFVKVQQNVPQQSNRQFQFKQPSFALAAVSSSIATHEDVLADDLVSMVVSSARKMASKTQKMFYIVGALVFLFATITSIQTLTTNKEAKEQLQVLGEQKQRPDENGVLQGTGSEPSEAEVPKNAIVSYQVSPELPRYLRIPDLGVVARIKHTGIDKDGAVDAPSNINDVSWFNGSARPGNPNGSSLLLGHVSGWTAPGVFKKINQLKAGMRFEVEKGSGQKLTYEVVRGESIPLDKIDMAKILASDVSGEHDLKLMTCSGRYNKELDHYEERYVVYAKILR